MGVGFLLMLGEGRKMILLEEQVEETVKPVASVKVVGVGGGGGNTINSIIESGCKGIEFYEF